MNTPKKNIELPKEAPEAYDALVRSGAISMGWNAPTTLDSTIEFFETLASSVHDQWIRAIELKVVPPEDVSPGEGFLATAKMLKGLAPAEAKARRSSMRDDTLMYYLVAFIVSVSLVTYLYVTEIWEDVDTIVKKIEVTR